MMNTFTRRPGGRWGRWLAVVALLLPLAGQAQFTAGRLVVVQAGASSAGAATVTLDEYTTGGTAGISVALPAAASGSNRQFRITGNSTLEGGLNRSANGEYLTLGGYDAADGAALPGTAAAVNRVVARIAADGTVNTRTAITNAFSSNSFRSVVTNDGTQFYLAGADDGVRYVAALGATTSTVISATIINLRQLHLAGGNLYFTTSSGSTRGTYQVGTGLPTSATTATSVISIGSTASPNATALVDRDGDGSPDVAYLVDNATSGPSGGIYKFSRNGSTWTFRGQLASTLGLGFITGRLEGADVALYMTSATGIYPFTEPAAAANSPIAGVVGPPLVTTSAATPFRGIAFVPVSAVIPNNPVPVITALAPAAVQAGDPAFTLTINGTGFVSAAVVTFNGTPRPATFFSSTQLTISLSAADLTTAGAYPVTVTNPGPGGGTATMNFTVTPGPTSNPVPTLASLNPAAVGAGATARPLTVNGSNFLAASVVSFNGTARPTTYVTAGQLTIDLTAADLATAGAYNVTVTNPAPGGGTATATFLVNPVPAPTLTLVRPTNPVGGATYAVTLTGTDFGLAATTTVNFNGTAVAPTLVNGPGTSLTVLLLLPAAGGTFPLTVTTPNGTSGAQPLTVVAPPADFFEPFEPGTQSGYPSTSVPVALRTGAYQFVEALLANTATDKFNNTQSLRIRGGGSVTMNFDKPTGAGVVTLSAALFSADAGATFTLAYSTDGGANFIPVPGTPATLSGTLTTYTFGLNVAGNVRLRIGTTNGVAGANPRINIDDLQITDFPVRDLVVSGVQNISGSYHNVTVTSGATAGVTGPLVVAGTLRVQSGGRLDFLRANCLPVTGPGNFVLEADATLQICDPSGIATTGPTGSVQVTGTRSFSDDANYVYNATAPQVTGSGLPARVRNLTGGETPLTLSGPLAVAQRLLAGDVLTNGQPLTLLSSAAGTALVVQPTGAIVGNVTVQRFLDNANPIGYRHYAAPVSNTTVADLAAPGFAPVLNPAYNSSLTPGALPSFPTVFGYDQGRLATATSNFSAFDKGWFSPTAGDPLVVGRGYTANVPAGLLVDFVGPLNDGPQPSGALNRGPEADAGWQFLGNPYPAPLDWSTVGIGQRPGVDAAMYVFESRGQYGGAYRTFANGMGPSPLIDVASGYFVRVSTPGTPGAVNLTNTNRVTTFGLRPTFGRGTADTRPQLRLQLRSATEADDTYVYFEAGATAGLDAQFDATKLVNPSGLNLGSLTGRHALAINGLPVLGAATALVPLTVGVPQAGPYTFRAADLTNFAGGTVTLVDALTGARTGLTTGATYACTLAGTTAPGRFSLEFRAAGALATTAAQALAAQVQLFPNPAAALFRVQLPVLRGAAVVSATLTNALGQAVLTRTLAAPAGQPLDAEFDVRALAAGLYTLRLDVGGALVVRKVVVE